MSDIIKLLPDAIANQIAAGEVIQRPASVVKELVENAIDAKATEITIKIQDAGKTLIQVIDNGVGMSETDARLAFERHATSKISSAEDLFSINTMGFRGEALASIVSIAHVELKTRREEDELGTRIVMAGSKIETQEPEYCPKGSNFIIKDLFFNIPARRKFLKSEATEFRHITDEFHRIAIANSEISLKLIHNNTEVYNLPSSNLRQRIVNIFGKRINSELISLKTETDIVKISGYIGKPEFAKKNKTQQFFFANGRYMKHPYFYRALLNAYKNVLPPDTHPSFFIFFEVNPQSIDINIHPTKTEIKFEEERFIFQLLQATVKESLGKFNIVPSIDFSATPEDINFPTAPKNEFVAPPTPKIDHNYNPFDNSNSSKDSYNKKTYNNDIFDKKSTKNWEALFNDNNYQDTNDLQQKIDINTEINTQVLIFKNKYAILSKDNKLISINLKRAVERINFDNFVSKIALNSGTKQKLLYPEEIEFSASDYIILNKMYENLEIIGFELKEVKPNTVSVEAAPIELENIDFKAFFDELINNFDDNSFDNSIKLNEFIANTMAKSISRKQAIFNEQSALEIINKLFNSENQNYTYDGKLIIKEINFTDF